MLRVGRDMNSYGNKDAEQLVRVRKREKKS